MTAVASASAGELIDADIHRIRPYKGQPRKFFDRDGLRDLAASFLAKDVGQQTPIVVKRVTGDRQHDFELVSGERRWQAAFIAGFRTLRAEVREFASEMAQFKASMAENGAREDLSPIEWARGIDRLFQDEEFEHLPVTKRYEAIGKVCGHSLSWAATTHVLLKLHPEVQAMLEPGAENPIKVSQGKELANNIRDDQALQLKIAKVAQTRKLTMNRFRLLMREMAKKEGAPQAIRQTKPSQDRRNVERMLAGIGRDCEHLLGMSAPAFRRALAGRPASEGLDMLETIDRAVKKLGEVREAIENSLPKDGRAARQLDA